MVRKDFFRDFGRFLGGLGWCRQVKNTITFYLIGGRWKVREGSPRSKHIIKERKKKFSLYFFHFYIKFSIFNGYKIVKLWLMFIMFMNYNYQEKLSKD